MAEDWKTDKEKIQRARDAALAASRSTGATSTDTPRTATAGPTDAVRTAATASPDKGEILSIRNC